MSIRDLVILGSSSQQPTRYRNHGAYLVRWNNEGFLFDPGEGTQRQFIFADIPPPVVNRILISHFHGDHCLGLGSMLMRLNLDKVNHPIHCYYPASGKKYFDRLRYGTIYHETIEVIEHPVEKTSAINSLVHDDGNFRIEATFLEHGVDNIGWRITEKDTRKFDRSKLQEYHVHGPMVSELEEKASIEVDGKVVTLDDVSIIRKGDVVAVVIDTRMCPQAVEVARNARLLLAEATYLDSERDLAYSHFHLTAKDAARIARDAGAEQLVLTHFSARYLDLTECKKEASIIFPHTHVAEDFKRFPFPKKKM